VTDAYYSQFQFPEEVCEMMDVLEI
jgi:hypothetical protein